MRSYLICLVCLLTVCASWTKPDDPVFGKYTGGFGGTIHLRKDSTFLYEWRFDLMYSWNRGTWSSVNDTVRLNVIPVFDTLTLNFHGAHQRDSLYLSRDSVAERFNQPELNLGYTNSQGTHLFPLKLIYENDCLYMINAKGKPDRKTKYKFGHQSFPSWYTRIE